MTKNTEYIYWRSNPAWYEEIPDSYDVIMKPDAPERAKRSYEMWKKRFGPDVEEDYEKE